MRVYTKRNVEIDYHCSDRLNASNAYTAVTHRFVNNLRTCKFGLYRIRGNDDDRSIYGTYFDDRLY